MNPGSGGGRLGGCFQQQKKTAKKLHSYVSKTTAVLCCWNLKGEEEHGEAEKISGGQDHMSYLVKIFSECQAIFITCSSVQRRLKQRLEQAVTIVLA